MLLLKCVENAPLSSDVCLCLPPERNVLFLNQFGPSKPHLFRVDFLEGRSYLKHNLPNIKDYNSIELRDNRSILDCDSTDATLSSSESCAIMTIYKSHSKEEEGNM